MVEQQSKRLHTLSLEARKKCSLFGVVKVLSYGEEELRLSTSDGKLSILGKGLKIESFDEGSGALSLSGEIDAIKYAVQKPPLLKRIFK